MLGCTDPRGTLRRRAGRSPLLADGAGLRVILLGGGIWGVSLAGGLRVRRLGIHQVVAAEMKQHIYP